MVITSFWPISCARDGRETCGDGRGIDVGTAGGDATATGDAVGNSIAEVGSEGDARGPGDADAPGDANAPVGAAVDRDPVDRAVAGDGVGAVAPDRATSRAGDIEPGNMTTPTARTAAASTTTALRLI
jgi:hypothetical protein